MADEKDLEFINGLQSLGVETKAAKLITYLKDVEEGSSRDIEMATGLRQPEVSIAIGTLRDMGWISEHEVKNPGKGRPQKIYALYTTIEEIIEHYETEKNHELARTIQAFQRLKELSISKFIPLKPDPPIDFTILHPSEGELWLLDQTKKIEWVNVSQPSQPDDSISLVLLKADFDQVGYIAKNLDFSQESYDWLVGLLDGGGVDVSPYGGILTGDVDPGNGYHIGINTYKSFVTSRSFNIAKLRVALEEHIWWARSTQIFEIINGNIYALDLALTRDNNVVESNLPPGTISGSKITYDVPDDTPTGDNFRIKVGQSDECCAYSEPFTIANFKVLSPNEMQSFEPLNVGDTETIRWVSTCSYGDDLVNIELLKTDGAFVLWSKTICEDFPFTPPNGAYDWKVGDCSEPEVVETGTDYKICVTPRTAKTCAESQLFSFY